MASSPPPISGASKKHVTWASVVRQHHYNPSSPHTSSSTAFGPLDSFTTRDSRPQPSTFPLPPLLSTPTTPIINGWTTVTRKKPHKTPVDRLHPQVTNKPTSPIPHPSSSNPTIKSSRRRCYRCGDQGHMASSCRNAKRCLCCGGLGHFYHSFPYPRRQSSSSSSPTRHSTPSFRRAPFTTFLHTNRSGQYPTPHHFNNARPRRSPSPPSFPEYHNHTSQRESPPSSIHHRHQPPPSPKTSRHRPNTSQSRRRSPPPLSTHSPTTYPISRLLHSPHTLSFLSHLRISLTLEALLSQWSLLPLPPAILRQRC